MSEIYGGQREPVYCEEHKCWAKFAGVGKFPGTKNDCYLYYCSEGKHTIYV